VNETLVTLPDVDEMMKRLIGVKDDPHVNDRLYPDICRMGGKEYYGLGVTMGLVLAIHDYSEGMPPIVENVLLMYVPKYLEALIDDEQVRRDALEHFEAARAATK
jgi:hypothetical protein